MIMNKILCALTALSMSLSVFAQTSDYKRRYDILLDRVGPAGVGMETLIENWSKVEPGNTDII